MDSFRAEPSVRKVNTTAISNCLRDPFFFKSSLITQYKQYANSLSLFLFAQQHEQLGKPVISEFCCVQILVLVRYTVIADEANLN